MDLERFSRNILLNEIDVSGQEKICNSKILCIGCGGLASFVLPLLVASGVKKIGIIDFDTIEKSNLPRQIVFNENNIKKPKIKEMQKFLQERNSLCDIKIFNGEHTIAPNIIQDYDCIADLTDSLESRLFCNKLTFEHQKPFFTGSAQGFIGHVYSFGNHLENLPCYECLFGEIKSNEITCENSGVFPPTVEIIGGFITSNILKYFIGIPIDFTQFLLLDTLSPSFIKSIKMNKEINCICYKK